MYNGLCMDCTMLVLIKHTEKQQYDSSQVRKGKKKTQPKDLKAFFYRPKKKKKK